MLLQHGSGKTAVLVERIIHKILEEDINIDELLVVTFTNAAASEMRQRILDAIYAYLEENPDNKRMQEQIVKMSRANICTIHSFCLDVIRNHFYEIGISPNIRIGEQSEMELLKRQVLEELFEEKYDKEDEEFLDLINTYTSYRGDDALKELILKIIKNISSNPFPEEWLEEKIADFNIDKIESDFAKSKWGNILLEEFSEEIQMCLMELESIKRELSKYYELDKFTRTINSDIISLQEIRNNLDSWDKVYNLANSMKWETWPRDSKIVIEVKDIAKEKRDAVKKAWNKIKDKFFICDSKQANEDMRHMYKKLLALKNIIFEFNQKFAKEKIDKNVMDFHDIEHFALKILTHTKEDGQKCPTQIALSYREKFKEIAIDEYQDSNLIQEYILNTISNGNNIFMVGDVKQSIYKFRQARPELFLEKYENYKLKEQKGEKDSLKIQLFKNFRSRKNVLDVTNQVFETIMSKELGDITYNEEEYLNLGADYPIAETNLPFAGNASIHVIDLKNEEEENDQEIEQVENAVLEAKFVAKQIQELMQSKYQVYDRKKGYRDICYKDIVILLRSTSALAPIYEKELNERDIPVFSDTGSTYFDSIEIQTVLSLLKIIDNPMQDIPFVSVLRSPIGGFDDNELISIKLNGNNKKNEYFYDAFIKAIENKNTQSELREKMQKFLQSLEKWRKQNEYMPLDEFIWQIYLETGYYHYVSMMPNGLLRQANLKMLFDRAREYEKASFKGLFNFINYTNQLKIASGDLDAAKLIGENEDVVRIMSIHKSKGLEFPVVILASTAKKFNLQDLNEQILIHEDLGIGPKYIDEQRKIEYPTLAKLAIGAKVTKETLSEEMRILYVALTRAKEKLIITGISKDFEKQYQKQKEKLEIQPEEKIDSNIIKQYKSYLDWIMLVYIKNAEKAKKIMNLEIHTRQSLNQNSLKENEQVDFIHFTEKCKEYKVNEEIKRKLEWEYPFKLATTIPTMTSVSKLKEMELSSDLPDILTLMQAEEKTKKKEKKVPEFLKDEVILTKARIGTLIHLCLQKVNEKEEYNLEKIELLIDDLVQKQFVTKKEADAISRKDLLNYTKSELFDKLKTANKIYKETPFYLDIEAKEIMKEANINEKVLVQGIIDLYYIDKEGNTILVDYKTDFVKEEVELIKKYQKQLEIYKRALEEATGQKVDKVYIYSVYLQKSIEVAF